MESMHYNTAFKKLKNCTLCIAEVFKTANPQYYYCIVIDSLYVSFESQTYEPVTGNMKSLDFSTAV